MEISLLKHYKVAKYEFEDYYTYYNSENGRIMNVDKIYADRIDEYIDINDFFGKPNYAENNKVITICINLTSRCNLRCKYCFNLKKESKDLALNDALNFIDKIIAKYNSTASKFIVDLSGSGEPLLMLKSIIKIADYCVKKSDEIVKDVIPQLVCNGTLLTKDVVAKLQEHRVLFGVSLDGYEEYHNKQRVFPDGTQTYNLIVNNVKQIDNNQFVGVAMTIYNEDIDVYKAYTNLAQSFNTISIRFARQNYKSFDFTNIINGYEKVCQFIIRNFKENDYSFLLKIINGDDYFGKCLLKAITNSYLERRCDANVSRFALGVDENQYPCSAYVYEKDCSIHKNESCLKCFLIHFCGGLCPIQSAYNSEKLCEFKKRIFELCLKLLCELQKENLNVYFSFLGEVEKILDRNQVDDELLEKYKKYSTIFKYSELKYLRDNYIDKYKLL